MESTHYPRNSMFQCQVEIDNRQHQQNVPRQRFHQAACEVLSAGAAAHAELGIAVVNNAEIHAYNRRFLQHDWPTDVITFPQERTADLLSGDIMLSSEYAAAEAENYGWSVEDEMTLYVIHGCLHLLGYDDQTAAERLEMRKLEAHYLERLGIPLPRHSAEDSFFLPGDS